jgi:hypothetical protein
MLDLLSAPDVDRQRHRPHAITGLETVREGLACLEAPSGEDDCTAQLGQGPGDRLGKVTVPAGHDRRPPAEIERLE